MLNKTLEKFFKVPAQTLEKTIDISKQITQTITNKQPIKKAEQYWQTLGPGLITGAADDDPSGVATYSQAGARFGFQFLWTAVITFPLMAVIQEMCARIGLVTGRGLAANIRMHFPKWVLYICTALLFFANSFNLSADLGAMAKASQLINPRLSFAFLVIAFALVSLVLQIFTSYQRYAKYLKWLALLLLSYVFSSLLVQLDWRQILKFSTIPTMQFSKDQIFLLTAILGTTISPYLFFWQTSQEVEEEILKGKTTILSRQGTTPEELKDMRIDVWSGMFVSNVVMYFIIAASAATLFAHGITNITSAAEAAKALQPLAGNKASLLFAIGIIGTGLLAVPILAGSASYAISESFSWRAGLYHKLKEAYAFYGVIIVSVLIGLALNFVHLDPIKALIYSAVGNGLVAPVVLILILLISSNKKIMGPWRNGRLTEILGWFITLVMIIAGIATIFSII